MKQIDLTEKHKEFLFYLEMFEYFGWGLEKLTFDEFILVEKELVSLLKIEKRTDDEEARLAEIKRVLLKD